MTALAKKMTSLLTANHGLTAVGYAMIIGLVFLAILTVITAIGQATATGPAEPVRVDSASIESGL